jgi:hypothetical protein
MKRRGSERFNAARTCFYKVLSKTDYFSAGNKRYGIAGSKSLRRRKAG